MRRLAHPRILANLAALVLAGAGTLMLVSCAGKPTLQFASDPAARFESLKTFAWYDDPSFVVPRGGSVVDGQFIDRSIREAVDRDLMKKGFTKAPNGKGDFSVAYHVDQVGVASQDKFGGYDWWSGYIYVGAKYRKEGSLTLDVRDAGNKLIWRANKTAIVGTNPEAVKRDIEDAVGDLLSKFPPKAAGERGQ
ncbi:MAG TPA: DUF4136 domain-containing protein [Thermoanaerobaculia bacterium]